MGRLLYSMIASTDGFVTDAQGHFDDWARPDEEVLEAVNGDTANVGTFLLGRKMYDMMSVWETDPAIINQSPQSQEFGRLWQSKQKVVYSTTLTEPRTTNTTLHSTFDPAEVSKLKESTPHDLTVDGPTLATEALRHGLVDEIHILVCPIALGDGLRMLPDLRINLRLRSQQGFSNGMVQLKYFVTH